MNYTGWSGYRDHERERPLDPNATAAFNHAVYEKEMKVERARLAREAAARKKREKA